MTITEKETAMSEDELEYEAARWGLLSRSAALCAEEAERVRRGLLVAQRRADGGWSVPGGTRRDAERARRTAAVVGVLGDELDS